MLIKFSRDTTDDTDKENQPCYFTNSQYLNFGGFGDSGKKRTVTLKSFEGSSFASRENKDIGISEFNRKLGQYNNSPSKNKLALFDTRGRMDVELSSIFTSNDSEEHKVLRSPIEEECYSFSNKKDFSPTDNRSDGFHIEQSLILPQVPNHQGDNGMVTTIHRKVLYHILESEKRKSNLFLNECNAMDIEGSRREKYYSNDHLIRENSASEWNLKLEGMNLAHSTPFLTRNSSLSDCSREEDLPLSRHMSLDLEAEDQINHCTAKWISEHPLPSQTFEGRNIELLILDCRFNYEYLGGHVRGALNINKPSLIEFLFVKSLNHMFNKAFLRELKKLTGNTITLADLQNIVDSFPSPIRDCTPMVVFHCEFSYCRAPELWKFLRKKDRNELGNCHPNLTFPQIYLLKEGYSKFFSERKDLCAANSQHIQMHDQRFESHKNEETRALSDDWVVVEGGKSKGSKRSKRLMRF